MVVVGLDQGGENPVLLGWSGERMNVSNLFVERASKSGGIPAGSMTLGAVGTAEL